MSSESLRERGKAKRRAAILDATLTLLREQPLDAVTVERIAEAAEVAPATVYNLVGGRAALLMALVDRVVDGLVDTLAAAEPEGADPLAAARLIVEQSARAFIADGAAFRQVIGALRELAGSTMAFDPAQLQVAAMRDAQAAGAIRPDLDPVALGRQILLSYQGALSFWAAGGLDDETFVAAATHGLLTVAAAAATSHFRRRFLTELADLGGALAGDGWSR